MATEGILGSIAFGKTRGAIRTFYKIDRKYKGRFPKHNIHLQKPLTAWAGNDLIEITLQMNLNAAWCSDPVPILAEFHFYHENAIAAPFLVGARPMAPGLSLFVITELSEGHEHWLHRGRLIKVTLDLTLEEYLPYADSSLAGGGGMMLG
jgi:hypothetical protein